MHFHVVRPRRKDDNSPNILQRFHAVRRLDTPIPTIKTHMEQSISTSIPEVQRYAKSELVPIKMKLQNKIKVRKRSPARVHSSQSAFSHLVQMHKFSFMNKKRRPFKPCASVNMSVLVCEKHTVSVHVTSKRTEALASGDL